MRLVWAVWNVNLLLIKVKDIIIIDIYRFDTNLFSFWTKSFPGFE